MNKSINIFGVSLNLFLVCINMFAETCSQNFHILLQQKRAPGTRRCELCQKSDVATIICFMSELIPLCTKDADHKSINDRYMPKYIN